MDDPNLSRWQGQTEAHAAENSRRLDGINGSIASAADDVAKMREELVIMRTKIGLYSAIGSLGGTGIVSLALLVLSK